MTTAVATVGLPMSLRDPVQDLLAQRHCDHAAMLEGTVVWLGQRSVNHWRQEIVLNNWRQRER